MEHCCRICFDKDKTLLSLQTVVEFGGTKLTCMQMYHHIIKLDKPVEESLQISQNICISCFGELNSCYKFQKKAIESYNVLAKSALEHSKELEQTGNIDGNKVKQLDIDENQSATLVGLQHLDEKDMTNGNLNQKLDQSTELDGEEYLEIDYLEERSQYDRPGSESSTCKILEIQPPETCDEDQTIPEDSAVVDVEYRCMTCSEILNSQAALDTHSIIEHCQKTNSGELICPVCNKMFGTRKTLRQHSRIHQNCDSRRYKCRFCEKAFNYGHHLRIHETTHTKEKPFPCSTCGKTFASKDRLTNHRLQHEDDFKYTCDSCSGCFRSKKALKMHSILKHDAVVDKFDPIKCDKCGKKLYSKSATSAHLKGPCGNDLCGFNNLEIVEKHVRKEHTCGQCFQVLKSRTAYNLHDKMHDAKESQCTHCPKVFTNSYDLQCHRSRVHEERTYTCEICGKSFQQMVVLKRHLKTHSGERSFMCAFCPQRFTQMATLKNHETTHSEVFRFACSRCPKKFKFLASLNNHVKMYHGGEEV